MDLSLVCDSQLGWTMSGMDGMTNIVHKISDSQDENSFVIGENYV
jgi:hypothetical protein